MPEDGSQRLEARSWRPEDRGLEMEARGWRPETENFK